MKRSIVETILGAVVLAAAGLFLAFSYKTANMGTPDGFHVSADFSGIGGLKTGDDVVISGVKVGTVTGVDLVPNTYQARVHMNVSPDITLPADTAAAITSQSLLGGRYLELQPGADEEMIENGGRIHYTQAPQNLEQLLGRFIFSMQKDDKSPQTADAAQPVQGPQAGE